METVVFPDYLLNQLNDSGINRNLFFYNYKANSESLKNKVIFTKNVFIFMIAGQKIIETLDKSYIIKESQAVLIKNGNCLTSEKFTKNGSFKCLTFFFDTKYLQEFFLKHADVLSKSKNNVSLIDPDVYVFEKDEFIKNYIDSALHILQIEDLAPKLIQLKFEEIMLYLIQKQGYPFLNFIQGFLSNPNELNFKATVESESLNKFTLDEIAFLCNMSLSTFKRHFAKSYGDSPQKWFHKKRMQYAYESIKNNYKTPSDLYLELGYNSLSSFSVAFSKIHGVPPTKI
jgi:AraC family transcriptional regulator, exoenzyme S synthesis regulatory protein ExsA